MLTLADEFRACRTYPGDHRQVWELVKKLHNTDRTAYQEFVARLHYCSPTTPDQQIINDWVNTALAVLDERP